MSFSIHRDAALRFVLEVKTQLMDPPVSFAVNSMILFSVVEAAYINSCSSSPDRGVTSSFSRSASSRNSLSSIVAAKAFLIISTRSSGTSGGRNMGRPSSMLAE